MSIQVVCSSCQGQFNAPDDSGGKRTKCPTCGGIISIPVLAVMPSKIGAGGTGAAFASNPFASPAPEVPSSTGEERKKCPMCGELIAAKAIRCRFCGEVLDASMRGIVNVPGDVSEPGWKTVRSGLKTLYYSIAMIFGTFVLAFIGGMIMAAAGADGVRGFRPGGADPPVGLLIFFLLVGLVILGAGIGALIGQIMCANVPASSGARGFAIASAICLVGYVIAHVLSSATDERAVRGVGGLLMMIGIVLFVLFIRRSASYLNNPQLASSSGRYLVFCVSLFGGAFTLLIIAVVTRADVLMGILGLVMIVCGLISIIWYLRLIRYLIGTIEQRVGAR